MKKINPLYKIAIFSYLIDPFFYIVSLLTVFFVLFRFFFVQKFFLADTGSTDLRPFFSAFPYASIITVPLLTFRLRRLVLLDSLPFFPLKRFLSLVLASFSAFLLPLFLLIVLPLCVSFFGYVDLGQCLSGFLGIIFYGLSAVALSLFFIAAFYHSAVLPLIFSSVLLALVNFVHFIPLYVRTGKIITFLAKTLSFAWHFDAFGKGILDSRNFFYYIVISFILILLASFFEYKRLGKKISSTMILLLTAIFIFLSMSAGNLYFRLDLTRNRQFSISQTSKNLLDELDGNLRITYFRSAELKNLYPQTTDVAEFLSDFASESEKVTLSIENSDAEKMKTLGIRGQQIQSVNETKTEFVTVFSAVLLQYLEDSELIPFVLTTNTLEYDLLQRVQRLVTEKKRKVYLLCGNGRSIEESYAYVEPVLASRGFDVDILNDFNATEVLRNLSANDEICIFGSKNLKPEQIFYIESALERGCRAFIATSPYHTTIEDEWKVSKSKDKLISYLNSKGFAFENALVCDVSCYPMTMESGDGGNSEYVMINYPLWPVLLNQEGAKNGAVVFWASPLALYDGTQPVLYTSNLSWTENEEGSEYELFLTNPFLIPKSAKEYGKENSQFVVAARKENISLVADQFFLSSLMTGFISDKSGGDFRNYDYLVKELLLLRGEKELADLIDKSVPVTGFFKIAGQEDFKSMRLKVIIICFVFLPFLILLLALFAKIRRRQMNVFWGNLF